MGGALTGLKTARSGTTQGKARGRKVAKEERTMRHGQRARYAERIERAIACIEQDTAAGTPPDLARLAAAAAMSEYHFHRVFRLMTGEAVGAAIARVRIAGSLPALVQGGVGAGTGQSGYATDQAYARALKARTGVSPAALARDPEGAAEVAARLSVPPGDEGTAMRIEIVDLAPLRLLAVRNVGAYAELNAGYGRLFEAVLQQLDMEDLQGLWGIPHDDPREIDGADCRFDCALDTGGKGQPAGDLVELAAGGGLHARAFFTGDYDLLHDRIDGLYAELIAADVPVGEGPLLIAYLDDPEEVSAEDQRAQVYLPVLAD